MCEKRELGVWVHKEGREGREGGVQTEEIYGVHIKREVEILTDHALQYFS